MQYNLVSDELEALLRQGNLTALIAACEKLLSKTHTTEADTIKATLYLAQASFRRSDFERGFAYLAELKGLPVSPVDMLTTKGLGHFLKGEIELAYQLYYKASTLRPLTPAALAGLGWCMREREPVASWEHFTSALRIDPSYRDALKGICSLPFPEGGQLQLEKILRQALDADPLDSETRLSLAVCLHSMGNTHEALCEATKVTLVDPTSTLARDLRSKLSEIMASSADKGVSQ